MWDVQPAFFQLLFVIVEKQPVQWLSIFQSVAYNLYEIPLFIAMGAIGKMI